MIEREVSGFHARVFQHEYDHLNGVLYPMQMDNLTTFGFVDEMKQGN
jgi:peptide deformylase